MNGTTQIQKKEEDKKSAEMLGTRHWALVKESSYPYLKFTLTPTFLSNKYNIIFAFFMYNSSQFHLIFLIFSNLNLKKQIFLKNKKKNDIFLVPFFLK